MAQFDSLLQHYLIIAALALIAIGLRYRGTIGPNEEGVFGRLVADFALPALVFASLSRHEIRSIGLVPASVLTLMLVPMGLAAYFACRALKFDNPTTGTVIIVGSVGATSSLGYTLIGSLFHHDPDIMERLVVMSEIGVVIPLFFIGVPLAIYFGEVSEGDVTVRQAVIDFFKSPIFWAVLLGIGVNLVPLPQNAWLSSLIFALLQDAGNTLPFLVAFSIGLMLRPVNLREFAALIALGVVLKMVFEPVLAVLFAKLFGFDILTEKLLVLDAALPVGGIGAVIAQRYGCNGAAAGVILIVTTICSAVFLPLVLTIIN